MKTARLKSIILLILSFVLIFPSIAQETWQKELHGVQLCDEIYGYISDRGFDITQQDLLFSDTTRFPQNLTITFSAENILNSNKNSTDSTDGTKTYDTIVFDIPQEFAYADLDDLCFFLDSLSHSNLSCNIMVLLSANNCFPETDGLEKDNDNHPSGTRVFTKTLGYDDNYSAVIVDEMVDGKNLMVVGSEKNVAPLWLVKTLYEGLEESGFSPHLNPFFSLNHSLNLAPLQQRLSLFLDKGVRAGLLNLVPDKKSYRALLTVAQKMSSVEKHSWDRNYVFFKLGEKNFWIPETSTITFSLFVIILVLILICFTGILPTPKSKALLKDIGRCWLIYPLTVILITLVIHGTQSVFSQLAVANPLLLATIKIFFAFILGLFAFIFLTAFNIRISLGAYGFLMIASSILNIFVFSCFNIILLYLFLAEFFLIFISGKVKSTLALSLTNILSISPFLVMLASAIDEVVWENVKAKGLFSWSGDILFAMILFPYMVQLVRIFISTDLLSQSKKLRARNYALIIVLSEVVMAMVLWGIYGIASHIQKSTVKKVFNDSVHELKDRDFPTTVANLSETDFMELSLRTLTVKSPDHVLRYEISVETENTVPLFESNYQYTLSDNKINFVIPDNPEGNLEIIYSADSSESSTVTVDAYIMKDGTVLKDSTLVITEATEKKGGQQ